MTGDRRETVATLLVCDLVDSTRIVQQLGDSRAAAMFEAHDARARELLSAEGGREIDRTDGFLLLFEDAAAAVRFALAYHDLLANLSERYHTTIAARIGIHHGPVILRENPPEAVRLGAKPVEVEGLAKPLTARLMSLAAARQTLLSREAADAARAGGRTAAVEGIAWAACGAYRLKGIDDPVEVFAVGLPGRHTLDPPSASAKARPLGAGDAILGWRPGPGVEVPGRAGWLLERRLGEGGFGEVWLARRDGEPEPRVFKFCFDAGRLRTLRREAALLGLLREALGRRRDIATIHGWSLEDPPFYLEMEYADGGDLGHWLEERGPEAVPLEDRVAMAASVAEALGAAHSVGVLHMDVKPSNVLVWERHDGGPPRVALTDFGIGALADPGAVERLRLTVTELEQTTGASAGTLAYMAPELFEGADPSIRTDIYALGVLTYQLVVGNFRRPMAPGWDRLVGDELLREDIAAMVAGDPKVRIGDAGEVARRLRALEQRREARRREREAEEAARRAEAELARVRRRRRVLGFAMAILTVFTLSVGWQAWRAERARRRAERAAVEAREVSSFLEQLFQVADPSGRQGATVTARELLDRGARRIRRELAGQPLTRARVERTVGRVYMRLGLLQRAEPLLVSAQSTIASQLGEDAPELAGALVDLGELRTRQGRYHEAEALLRRAERLARGGEDVRRVLEARAALYQAAGRFEELHAVRKQLAAMTGPEGPMEPGEPGASRVSFRPDDREVFRLAAAIPFPGRVSMATVLDISRGILLLASPESVTRLDERGVAPPLPLKLDPGDVPIEALPSGRLLVGTRHGLVFRGYDPLRDAREDRPTGIDSPRGSVVTASGDGQWIAVARGRKVGVYRTGGGRYVRIARLELPFAAAPGLVRVGGGVLVAVNPIPGGERLVALEISSGTVLLDRKHDWTGKAQALDLEPLGGWIAVGGWFDDVLVYSLRQGGSPERVSLPGATNGLAFYPDFPSLVIAKVGRVALWQRGKGLVKVHEDPAGRFFLAGRTPSTVLVGDTYRHRVLRFAYRTVRVRRLIPVATQALWCMAYDPTARQLFAGSEDGTLARYEFGVDRLRTVRAHGQGVTAMLLAPPRLVTASDDRTIAVWNPDSLHLERRLEAHGYLVNALQLDREGTLWTASSDHTVRAWRWPALEAGERVDLPFSVSTVWMDPASGVGIAGGWDGSWAELERREGRWRLRARHRWWPEGLYRVVELPGQRLVLLVGIYPSRLAVFDPWDGVGARVQAGPGAFAWAAFRDGGVVVFGDECMGLLQVQRLDAGSVRVKARWVALTGVGSMTSGVVAPGERAAIGGSDRGELVEVSLPAMEGVPPVLDTVLALGPFTPDGR